MPPTSSSLKNLAIFAVLAFSTLSTFLFVQHEMHSMNREAAGLDVSYKKLRKGVVLFADRARDYFHVPQQPTHNGATNASNIPSNRETVLSPKKNDDTPDPEDDETQDDDIREDDDDNIQEPGEEPHFNGRVGSGVAPVVEAILSGSLGNEIQSASKEIISKVSETVNSIQSSISEATNTLLHKPTEGNGDKQLQSSTSTAQSLRTAATPATPPTTITMTTATATTATPAATKVVPTATAVSTATTPAAATAAATSKPISTSTTENVHSSSNSGNSSSSNSNSDVELKGKLVCDGKEVDSEVIYWKIVPGDIEYESPITPHHGDHHDRYLSFEYDQGGWNNVRMSLECLIVVAHAMGRTLVVPPQQHLYLLGRTHKDKHDKQAHDEMGFEDFFDIDLLRSHRGYHVLHMEEFLQKEGVTGGLHGQLPPGNTSKAWGEKLWRYLKKVADETPTWQGHYVVFPDHPGNFTKLELLGPDAKRRIQAFSGGREPVFYDEKLQQAHHIHFPADGAHRILQHHYAFAFFASKEMQSFYRRFVRDFMRYRDVIQCAGHELVQAVRGDALKEDPLGGGKYYALHVRRGDFQYKDVKLSAEEIVRNLKFPNGTPIIPPGSLVYLSTDDPDGVCEHCLVNRQPCESYMKGSKPPGCPEDPSWNAFIRAGWKLRLLRDYLKRGFLKDVNPNQHGMIESIVCSRAAAFAGTYYSTFTGYIHRLRGYHGLGESTYYHTNDKVFQPQMTKSVGNGFSREWRAGWTDDAGGLI